MIDWNVAGQASKVDMGNAFSVVKFTNVMNCNTVLDMQPWFVGGKICDLQTRKPNFVVKENLLSVLLWVRLHRLPPKMWNEKILRNILKPIGRLNRP